ncbi:MAG: hypothetical protein MJ252_02720 [archaeon]|nr:hypothetical protein [archaeon]
MGAYCVCLNHDNQKEVNVKDLSNSQSPDNDKGIIKNKNINISDDSSKINTPPEKLRARKNNGDTGVTQNNYFNIVGDNSKQITLEDGLTLNIEDYKRAKKNEITVILTGPKNTGKTTFVTKYIYKKFYTEYNPTIGVDKNNKKITFDNEEIKINFVEPCWNENERKAKEEEEIMDYPSLFKEADFILIFYDKSDKEGFLKGKEFLLTRLRKYVKVYNDIMLTNFFFVGTKIDLCSKEKDENDKIIRNYCSRNNFISHEISSKTNKGVNELIKFICQKYRVLYPTSNE